MVADQRWMLWLARDPFDAVRVTGLDGTTQTRDFFDPSADEGLIPMGYAFPLPRDSVGQQRLRLALQGSVRGAPTPRILSEQDVLRQAGLEFALACTIYASLVTLLIASLVLYPAVRDPIFLLYSAYVATALLFVATLTGQVYALPWIGVLGQLGARGVWFVILLFNAMALRTLVRFAETGSSASVLVRQLDRLAMVMWLLVLVPLLPLQAVSDSLQSVAKSACLVAMLAGMLANMDGARRGVQMTVAAAVALLLLLLAALAHEAMQRAWLGDAILTRHGYQFVLVLMSLIMFVGLSSRIGLVRQRLADETSARLRSETRLRQERTRAGFGQSLRDGLRGVAEDDVATVAFRMLGEHARVMTGAGSAVVLGHGYLGQDLLLVQPEGQATGFAQYLLVTRGLVRTHALAQEPVNVRLGGMSPSDMAGKPLVAVIPLRLAAPAWAALVLQQAGEEGFDATTLSALTDMAKMAVLHADEAYAAIQLRRTAEHDSLTGTRNRRGLDDALSREFKAHGALESPLALLFIDVDWFKSINDRLGHAAGDLCIRSIATSLRGELRPDDVMGRYGGDEFLVMLPGRKAAAARIVADRLRKAVEASKVFWQGEAVPLTVSIGMATRRESDGNPAALLERTDKALYAAKQQGRNRVCVAPAVVD